VVELPARDRDRDLSSTDDLSALRGDVASRPGRLLLLAGPGAVGLAKDLAAAWDGQLTSLGRRFADLGSESSADPSALLDGGSIFMDIDVLFWEPNFRLEILAFLRSVARKRPVAFVWPGEIKGGVAGYSETGRNDFYEATLEDAIVLRVRPDAYAGEPAYTMEQVGA
jgi:hypothetical protein